MAQILPSDRGEKEVKKKKRVLQSPNTTTKEEVKIVKKAAPLAKELAKQDKNLSNRDEKKVEKILKSETKISKEIEKADKGDKSPVSNFTKALTFFAPQIIGALGGAIGGGTEGALMGLQAGGEARDSFLAHGQAERELDIKEGKAKQALLPKPKTFQQARDAFVKENGKLVPAIINPNTGEISSSVSGRVVTNPNDIVVGEQRRERAQTLNEKKAGQIANIQAESLASFSSSLGALDNIDVLKPSVNTGPAAGRLQSIGALGDLSSNDFIQLRVESENVKADFLKAMSGAQVSEQEALRLSKIIPNVNDDDETFKQKSTAFRQIMNRHREAILQSIETGQPLRADVIQEMRTMSQNVGEVTTNTPQVTEKDIDNMSKEQLKAFLGE